MKMIIKGRGEGKTTEFIKMSAETGCRIVCISMMECHRVLKVAKEMGYHIPKPEPFHNLLHGFSGRGERLSGYLIDNLDLCLQQLTPIPIMAVSLSVPPYRNINWLPIPEKDMVLDVYEVLRQCGKDGRTLQ